MIFEEAFTKKNTWNSSITRPVIMVTSHPTRLTTRFSPRSVVYTMPETRKERKTKGEWRNSSASTMATEPENSLQEKPILSPSDSLSHSTETLEQPATPWIDYAIHQSRLYQKTIEETLHSALEASKSRLSEIRSTSSAHFSQTIVRTPSLSSSSSFFLILISSLFLRNQSNNNQRRTNWKVRNFLFCFESSKKKGGLCYLQVLIQMLETHCNFNCLNCLQICAGKIE